MAILSGEFEDVIVTTVGRVGRGEIRRVTEFETPPGPVVRIEERAFEAVGGLN